MEAIGQSDGIVYIEFGYCAFGRLNGCLLPFIAPSHGDRYLRIVVTPDRNRCSHDQLLALLAHELRHALEVIEHREVTDVATMNVLYARIGTPQAGGVSGYETSAVRAAGDQTLAELGHGNPRPHEKIQEPIERALALFASEEIATMPRVVLATVKPNRLRIAPKAMSCRDTP